MCAASLHEDAAYFAPGPDCRAEMGALVFDAAAGCFYLSSIVVPSELLPLLFGDKKNYIGPLEALASAAVDFTYPDVLSGRLAIYFVDNQGSLACMVRGSSDDSATSAIAHCAALRQQRQGTRVWYEYVASSANLADLPSRGRLLEAARLLRHSLWQPLPGARARLQPEAASVRPRLAPLLRDATTAPPLGSLSRAPRLPRPCARCAGSRGDTYMRLR